MKSILKIKKNNKTKNMSCVYALVFSLYIGIYKML